MKGFFEHALTNWKTTAQSILTTTFAVTGALMVSSIIAPHTAAILTVINAIAKIGIGAIQTDSPSPIKTS
jgi:hypothetical protein